MNRTEYNALKQRIITEGLKDGATIYHESGKVFDPAKSDWDGEGLAFILGNRRRLLSESQYNALLTAYGKALTTGGRSQK